MTIDQIEMIEAIVREGSMQKAAKKLHKSQPSLSVGIKKIEDFYGIKIFSRDSYRPTLTNEGEIFYRNALPVLQAHRRLHKVASELGTGVESEIRIFIDPLVSLSNVHEFLKVALSNFSTTQVIITADVLDGPLEALINHQAQFAIGHCPPHLAHMVLKKRICQLELIPVIKKGVKPDMVPNIVVSKNTMGPALLQDIEKPTNNTWIVSNHARKEELILAGLGWGRMHKAKIAEHKTQISVIKSLQHLIINLEIYLMINKEAPLGKVGQAMWQTTL